MYYILYKSTSGERQTCWEEKKYNIKRWCLLYVGGNKFFTKTISTICYENIISSLTRRYYGQCWCLFVGSDWVRDFYCNDSVARMWCNRYILIELLLIEVCLSLDQPVEALLYHPSSSKWWLEYWVGGWKKFISLFITLSKLVKKIKFNIFIKKKLFINEHWALVEFSRFSNFFIIDLVYEFINNILHLLCSICTYL